MKNRILIWNNDASTFPRETTMRENVIVVDALDVTRNRAVSLECACYAEIVYCCLMFQGPSLLSFIQLSCLAHRCAHACTCTLAQTQKAFDKVPHQRLISKLKSHGMGNSIINWIEQWLKDRRQRVVVDGEVSSWKSVLIGVPQGSVLGPILFLVYINDLEEGVTGKILKFADDTKLFRKVKEIGDKQNLQDDIDKLVKWSEKWQMLFNFGKCKCLHTGSGNTGMNHEMGGTILSKTVKEKYLG